MTFAHTKDSRVFLNERHVSGQVGRWTFTHSRGLGSVTSLLDSGEKSIPGLKGGAVAIGGSFDSAQYVDTEVQAAIGTDNGLLVTVAPYLTTIESPALLAVADAEGYVIDASVSETVSFGVDLIPDEQVDMGLLLNTYATAITADGSASTVDNATSTSGGAVANLHVTDYATLTSIDFIVEHSTDDTNWDTILTFTQATGVTSERQAVTGTVNRYVRVAWDVTGSGSASFVLAFARR